MISGEAMDLMIQEITMGISKEESYVMMTQEASETWDILAVQIAQIKEEGFIVDIPSEIPTVDIVDPTTIPDPVE